jgi:hypothetical protein
MMSLRTFPVNLVEKLLRKEERDQRPFTHISFHQRMASLLVISLRNSVIMAPVLELGRDSASENLLSIQFFGLRPEA